MPVQSGQPIPKFSKVFYYPVLINHRHTRNNNATRGWGGIIQTGPFQGWQVFIHPQQICPRVKADGGGPYDHWDREVRLEGQMIYCLLTEYSEGATGHSPYFIASEVSAVYRRLDRIYLGDTVQARLLYYDLGRDYYQVTGDGPPVIATRPRSDLAANNRLIVEGEFRVTARMPGCSTAFAPKLELAASV